MLETFSGNKLEYKKLSQDEMKSRGILGRLVGRMCNTKDSTRNGRFYSKELWNNAMNDPIFKEKLENHCILAELEHPTDGRTQIDPTKACACLAEMPKLGEDGYIYGIWDILNTGNGQILKTLCDYGTTIGISSRGEGDIIDGFDGSEVDPNSYSLETFDMVLLPAVKEARMQFVTESLGTKTLKATLQETIEKAAETDKAQMQETVNRLFEENRPTLKEAVLEEDVVDESATATLTASAAIAWIATHWDEVQDGLRELGLTADKIDTNIVNIIKRHKDLKPEECNNPQDCADKEEVKESIGVEDIKPQMINELQEALKAQKELKASTKELQGKLAVSDAKVQELSEELTKYKDLAIKLSESAKNSKELNKSLTEKLNKADAKNNSEAKALTESVSKKSDEVKSLNEKLAKAVNVGKTLNESVKTLKEELNVSRENLTKANDEIKDLKESLEDEKQNTVIKTNELTSKVTKAVKIAEAYKKAANDTMDHYIESKARMLGVSKNEIKNRLAKTYTVNDVDTVCESLRSYRLNMSKLPFELEGAKVKFTESRNDNLRIENLADEIDDQLIEMVRNLH